MGSSRQDLRDVRVEDDPLTPAVGSPDDPNRRVPRWWWAIAGGLAVIVAAGTVLTDRREDARLAALRDVPGILAPLTGPLDELWRADGSQFSELAGFAGHLLAVEHREDGIVDVVALEPRTGAAAWRANVNPAGAAGGVSCALPDPYLPADEDGVARVVACVVVDQDATRLLVLDAASGDVLSARMTDPGAAVWAAGPDLVIRTVGHDGSVRVTRTDPITSTVRWTFVSAGPGGTGALAPGQVQVVGDLVVVSTGPDGTLAGAGGSSVLSADGSVLHTWRAESLTGAHGQVDVLAGGQLLGDPVMTAGGTQATRILDLDTGRTFTATGRPLAANPDDGSLVGLLVLMASTTGDSVLAYDVATGERLWADPGAIGSVPLAIDGRVVRTSGGELRSIDGLTGRTIWTTPVRRSTARTLLTDGRLVLLTRLDGDAAVLAAYGLDDGLLRWETPIPADLYLTANDGALYGRSRSGLVAFGTRTAESSPRDGGSPSVQGVRATHVRAPDSPQGSAPAWRGTAGM